MFDATHIFKQPPCRICKLPSYSDWGMCQKCVRDEYFASVRHTVLTQNKEVGDHVLGILWDNAYMSGRSDLALSLGAKSVSKDKIEWGFNAPREVSCE